jgi:redox-sensitive bicupin YhaK (pirin superfamily)
MREHGGLIHGIQAWVALPAEHEETDPAFTHFDALDLPTRTLPGAAIRLIAGEAFDLKSSVPTHSRLFYAHADLDDGATIDVPTGYTERAMFVAAGSASIDTVTFEAGQLVIFLPGTRPSIRAHGETTLMLLGGEPLGERHIYWNFVSSRPERIEKAKADWHDHLIPLPVDDDREFIPLPDTPPPPPEPMS